MNIEDMSQLNFEEFQKKIKMLDYTYPEKFILELFEELNKLKPKEDNNNNNYNNKKKVSPKEFLDEINYIKPLENYKSFINKK